MATKSDMTVDQHVQTALTFLDHSDREFAAGDALQGSEKLWGAASHVVTAIAKQRGWPSGKYQARLAAVKRLAGEHDAPILMAQFLPCPPISQQFLSRLHGRRRHGRRPSNNPRLRPPDRGLGERRELTTEITENAEFSLIVSPSQPANS